MWLFQRPIHPYTEYPEIRRFGGDALLLRLRIGVAGPVVSNGITTVSYVALTDSGTLTNTGLIATAVTMTNGASLNNSGTILASTDAVITDTGSAMVSNSGVIQQAGSSGIISGSGLLLTGGGSLTNTATGIISGGRGGAILFSGSGFASVVNAGTIRTVNVGVGESIELTVATNTLFNSGTISGAMAAVYLEGGTIRNTGLIGANNVVLLGTSGVYLNSNLGIYGVYASNGATITNTGTVQGRTEGVLAAGGGTILNTGTILGGISAGGGETIANVVTIQGTTNAIKFSGTIANRLIYDQGATFIDAMAAGAADVLELAAGPSAGSMGTITASQFTAFKTIQEDSGASWKIAGTFAASTTITMLGSGDSLTIGITNFTAPIVGFMTSDTIDMSSDVADHASLVDTTLVLTENGNLVGTLTLDGNYTGRSLAATPDNTCGTFITELPCFAAGTHIDTPDGPTAVETLRAGDLVLTASGATRPVRLIGHRHLNLQRHPEPSLVQPIRFMADSIADSAPRRDLLLSPDHAVFIDDRNQPWHPVIRRAITIRGVDHPDNRWCL